MSKLNWYLTQDYPRFVGQEEIIVNHILLKECEKVVEVSLRVDGDTITPLGFFDCLLFVGLYMPECKGPVLDVYDMYTYYDSTFIKGKHDGRVAFNVRDRNRLSLGYSGPVFEKYRRVICDTL
jgi:hypothetical protein